MLEYLEKHRIFISTVLIAIALTTLLFWPMFSNLTSMAIFLISPGMVIVLSFQKHQRAYQNAEATREKMLRKFSLDVIGLLLVLAAAILAGEWAGGALRGHVLADLASNPSSERNGKQAGQANIKKAPCQDGHAIKARGT